MKISYQWLLELTGLDWTVDKVADRLTLSGTACEDITSTARHMEKVVVGEVLAVEPVKGADKIRKTEVTDGTDKYNVICGAPNVAVGQRVPFAKIGARLAGDLDIEKVTIRGVGSFGMICSEAELGISQDHSGIMVLQPSAKLGQPLVEHLDFDDYILDFELTPDRADSMSAIGIARDLAALAGVKVKYPGFSLKESAEPAAGAIGVKIADPEACPRFTARIIKNVTSGPSPWWLKKRLLAAGMRPISNVVDITNFVMLEMGNPIHAFDLARFGSNEVLVRRGSNKERLVTLDGEERELTSEVLLITDGKEAKAAAGVMGGLDSEVTEDTTDILLEVAYFNPSVIRKSRRQLGLISEASQRFEKGVDPNNLPTASARVAHLLSTLCGGEVMQGLVDSYPRKKEPVTVSFRPDRCNKVLGTDWSTDRMLQIFEGLEFSVKKGSSVEVSVPTFRHDIEKEIDLIEEVARIEGYHNITDAVENIGPLFTPRHYTDRFEDELRHMLTGGGFDEMVGHGLGDSRVARALNADLPQLRILNPVSEELDVMRNSMVISAVAVAQHNFAHRNMDLRLFEIGKVYFPPDKAGTWNEEERLLVMVSGRKEENWRDVSRPLDFYDLTGMLEQLSSHFMWPAPLFEHMEVPYFDDKISFQLRFGDIPSGTIGRLNDQIAEKFDLSQSIYIAEIALRDLIAISGRDRQYRPLPVFPAAPRDLAIVIDDSVKVGELLNRLRDTAGALADEVKVFDVYSGKQIESGKRSVGVAITYRSPDRSLESSEVDEIQQNIMAMLKREFNAEIREK
jgi:phenylalanyl-tRNA synthetase beta chain